MSGLKKSQPTETGEVWVTHGESRRPFMRGILVHSLMSREISFDDALHVAEMVRKQIHGAREIDRSDLAGIVSDVVRKEFPDTSLQEVATPAPIRVGLSRDATPFSKGRLSQSLLASAIDPSDAFDAAREIELALRRRGRTEISRAELRRLAHATLCERFGDRTGERYLCWRHYQEPERPVVILLGGTTGAGKTSVALEVALRLGISRVLSTDSIRQVMRTLIPRELVPALHVSSFDAHRELPAAIDSESPAVDGFIAQASAMSLGARAMIDRAVEENASLVLDGVPLAPGLLDVEGYRDVADVMMVIVARLDEEAFASHFATRAERERRRESQRYVENLDAILEIQNYILGLADGHDIPIVDNVDLDSAVRQVIKHVVDTLREKGEIDFEELLR
ncbi:MAG: hypothetical protein GY910_26930 [bacterium]|nr:hypothetical protein [bacterium]